MTYSLNSFNQVIQGHTGDYIADYSRVTKGDTRSLYYNSYDLQPIFPTADRDSRSFEAPIFGSFPE